MRVWKWPDQGPAEHKRLAERLKEFRRIATRYDKTDESFAAAIYLVAALLALK
jgi:transposase